MRRQNDGASMVKRMDVENGLGEIAYKQEPLNLYLIIPYLSSKRARCGLRRVACGHGGVDEGRLHRGDGQLRSISGFDSSATKVQARSVHSSRDN